MRLVSFRLRTFRRKTRSRNAKHRVRLQYAWICSTGTSVKSVGIQSGDEVFATSIIISCALAVIRAGATPIYVDADPQTWNMNVNDIVPSLLKNESNYGCSYLWNYCGYGPRNCQKI